MNLDGEFVDTDAATVGDSAGTGGQIDSFATIGTTVPDGTESGVGSAAGNDSGGTCPDRAAGKYGECRVGGETVVEMCGGAVEHTSCLVNGDSAVCAVQGCSEACDCPAAPSGEAQPACGQVVADDPANYCFLDCQVGACPGGMVCRPVDDNKLCVWRAEPDNGDTEGGATDPTGTDGAPTYGACAQSEDCASELCLGHPSFSELEFSACVQECEDGSDCPDYADGTVECVSLPVVGQRCILSCASGTCPSQMSCREVGGVAMCLWPA